MLWELFKSELNWTRKCDTSLTMMMECVDRNPRSVHLCWVGRGGRAVPFARVRYGLPPCHSGKPVSTSGAVWRCLRGSLSNPLSIGIDQRAFASLRPVWCLAGRQPHRTGAWWWPSLGGSTHQRHNFIKSNQRERERERENCAPALPHQTTRRIHRTL